MTQEAIKGRINQIKAEIENTDSDFDREKLQERLAKLSGGVAVVKVGAATETEMKEKKHRVEDALQATRAALEEGIVPGGGVALLESIGAVDLDTFDIEDEKTGAKIVVRALEEPLRQIAENAGYEGSVVVNDVRKSPAGEGLNAATGEMVDLVQAGVIDPAMVTRSALQNAASIAKNILTTEAIVAEAPDKDGGGWRRHARHGRHGRHDVKQASACSRTNGPGTRRARFRLWIGSADATAAGDGRQLDRGAPQPLGLPARPRARAHRPHRARRRRRARAAVGPRDLGGVPVAFDGSTTSVAESLAHTYADGVCVIHDGAIVFEHYADGMRRERHAPAHVGVEVAHGDARGRPRRRRGARPAAGGDGVRRRAARHRVGGLHAAAPARHAGRHALRRGGLRRPRQRRRPDRRDLRLPPAPPPRGAAGHRRLDRRARQRSRARQRFKYRSILTDVLAWAAAEATGTRFPDLFSQAIWSRIGAEWDAEIIVDTAGFPAAEGGICATLRDLARFGLMHLDGGVAGGRRVVPAAWIDRLLTRDDELVATFDSELLHGLPHAFYHDCWWVWDAEAGIYSGYGINGQQLLIHRPSRTVIARLSTWPVRHDDRLFALADAANRALLAHLSG